MTSSSRQNKILVDTNSYIRLAQNIHPLLRVPFGEDNTCLYVLPELERELNCQPRLQTRFPWVLEEEYAANRKGTIGISKIQKQKIEKAFPFMKQYALTIDRTPSDVDIKYCATGFVMKYSVVTDDLGMTELGEEFDVTMISTLGLLSMMKNAAHVDLAKIRAIAEYLDYCKDIPAKFYTEYRLLFGEEAPRFGK